MEMAGYPTTSTTNISQKLFFVKQFCHFCSKKKSRVKEKFIYILKQQKIHHFEISYIFPTFIYCLYFIFKKEINNKEKIIENF